MNYPLISEYIEAIKAAEDNFEQLKNLRPVLDEAGEPVMSSGTLAVVFKMKDEQTGKLHAVKCFLKEQEGRADAYRQIAEELEFVSSAFLTPIKYLDKELFVDSSNSENSEFPVLLMDWVEGQTLDKYIREHIDDQYDLSLLAYQFSRLAMWLMPQPFAHGDLKPDNILVRNDGTLALVDYDGMYVPAMKGQKARELGSPDFRHPSRTEDDFDEHIDDFSLASILLSLKAIALQPSLLEEYGAPDRLLFSEKDFRNLSESQITDVLKPLMQNAELASLYSLYILALSQDNLSQVSFRLFNLSRPDKSQYKEKNLSTEVTEEDLENAWTDEFGVKYSADRKRLLSVSDSVYNYINRKNNRREELQRNCSFTWMGNYFGSLITVLTPIQENINIIGDRAFKSCKGLRTIIIPNSIEYIGNEAFRGCSHLKSIIIPQNVVTVGTCIFSDIDDLSSVIVDEKNQHLDSRNNCNAIVEKNSNKLIAGCVSTVIPDNITIIGERAFCSCAISHLRIPNSIIKIEKNAFEYCYSLKSTVIPNSVKSIGDYAFKDGGLTSVKFPVGIEKVGKQIFSGCKHLTSIIIPSGTRMKYEKLLYEYKYLLIEEDVISHSTQYSDVDIEEGIRDKFGGIYSKDGKRFLKYDDEYSYPIRYFDFNIKDGVEIICNYAFSSGQRLKRIFLPSTVTTIGNGAFSDCSELEDIELPVNLTYIGDKAFFRCVSLKTIVIPEKVSHIGTNPFAGCCLPKITCYSSNFYADDHALYDKEKTLLISLFYNVTDYSVPKSVVKIGDNSCWECSNLETIECQDGLLSIGESAFYLSSLRQINLPDTLLSIGECAFANTNIPTIYLPSSIERIGEDAFADCDFCHSIIVEIGYRNKFESMLSGCKQLIIEVDYPKRNERITYVRSFSSDEIAVIKSAFVTKSQNVQEIRLDFIDGGYTFIPLNKKISLSVGAEIDINKVKFIIHCQNGYIDTNEVLVED